MLHHIMKARAGASKIVREILSGQYVVAKLSAALQQGAFQRKPASCRRALCRGKTAL